MHGIGIIGAGEIAERAYLPTISALPDCRLRAICSRQGASAQRLAGEYGIEHAASDYREVMSRADVDTVIICTPTHLHYEMCDLAMAEGKNILVEKPLCSRHGDSRELIRRARAYGKTFYVAFNNRFRSENRWLKRKVLAGDIGEPELLDFEWFRTRRFEAKSWLYDRSLSGGGVLIDLGAHLVNLALDLLPNRRTFKAFCRNRCKGSFSPTVEDTSICMVTIDDSISILLKVGWSMGIRVPTIVNLDVYGGKEALSSRDYQGERPDGHPPMIRDFLEHVEGGTSPDLDLVEDTMMLLYALYRSDRSDGPVAGSFASLA